MKRLNKKIFCILALPFIAKLLAIIFLRGGGDAWNFNAIYQYIANDEYGLFAPYFPASYVYIVAVGKLNDFFGYTYSFWQRLTCLVFEIIGFIFIYKISIKIVAEKIFLRSILMLAYSPIAFFVVGLHGNYDSLVFLFIILSAYYAINQRNIKNETSMEGLVCLIIATLIKPYALVFFVLYIFLTTGVKKKIYYVCVFTVAIIISITILLDTNYIINSFKTILYYPHSSQAGWNSILRDYLSDNQDIWMRRLYVIITKSTELLIIASIYYIGSLGRHKNTAYLFFLTSLAIVFLSGSIVMQYLYWIIPFGIFTSYLSLYFIYNLFGFIWIINYSLYLYCKYGVLSSMNQFIPYGFNSINYSLISKIILNNSDHIILVHNVTGNIILPIVLMVWIFLELRKVNFDRKNI